MNTTIKNNKMRRPLALMIAVLMIVMLAPFSAGAAPKEGMLNSMYSFVSDANAANAIPALSPGEVWANRNVVANADGTFTVTLWALGANYGNDSDKHPLMAGTQMTVTDTYNNSDFIIVAGSVSGTGVNTAADGKVVWTIPAANLSVNPASPSQVTYKLELKAASYTDGKTFYTHPEKDADAKFTVTGDNWFYWSTIDKSDTTVYQISISWNNGNGDESMINSIGLKNTRTGAWIIAEKGWSGANYGTKNNGKWYKAKQVIVPDCDCVGCYIVENCDLSKLSDKMVEDLIKDGYKRECEDPECGCDPYGYSYYIKNYPTQSFFTTTDTGKGSGTDKTFFVSVVISKGNGEYDIYKGIITPVGNNGGSGGTANLSKTTVYSEKKPVNGNDGDGNVALELANRGWITLTLNEVPVKIEFTKAVTGGSTGNFTFQLFKDADCTDAVEGATATISSGAGKIEIEDILPEMGTSTTKTFWLKETVGGVDNGGVWTNDTTAREVVITIANGNATATFPNDDSTFTNEFSKHYKVTVEYYILGAAGADSTAVAKATYFNGDNYKNETLPLIKETYKDLAFVYGETSKNSGIVTTYNEAKALADDVIANGDVTIKLYYIAGDVSLSLTKLITHPSDAEPANYSFEFSLYNSVNSTLPIATLTFAPGDFDEALTATKAFTLSGLNLKNDILGRTFYISERITDSDGRSVWTPGITGRVEYATVSANGGVTYADAFKGNTAVENKFDKTSIPVTIELTKTFTGNLDSFNLQGLDGSVAKANYNDLLCEIDAHEHDDACYVPGLGNLICDLEDCDHEDDACFEQIDVLDCDIAEHEHDDDCYGEEYYYTFYFDVKDSSGNIVASDSLELSAAEIRALVENDGTRTITFTVPADATYTVVERFGDAEYIGWTLAADETVTASRLGGETIPVDMENEFGGSYRPSFRFAKEVLEARLESRNIRALYNGTFEFDLFDGETMLNEEAIVIDVRNGYGRSDRIYLDDYINKDATLTLKERTGEVEWMNYDEGYDIVIVNGKITSASIVFKNYYMTPVHPAFSIVKTTNGIRNNATFEFNYSYAGFSGNEELSDEGSTSIRTRFGLGADLIARFIPVNFTGTLTVSEADGGIEGWVYDNNEITIEFKDGIPASLPVASFNNNFFAPNIEVSKNHNQADEIFINDRTEVIYTIAINNVGTEILKNVEIKDELFNSSVEVLRPAAGTDTQAAVLEEGVDYTLTGDTLTLLKDLDLGEMILINYTVEITVEHVNDGKIENSVDVMGKGKFTNIDVGDDGDTKIIIDSGKVAPSILKEVGAVGPSTPSFGPSVTVNDRGFVTFRIKITAEGNYYTPDEITYRLVDSFNGVEIDEDVVLTKGEDNNYGPAYKFFTTQVRNFTDEQITLTNTAFIFEGEDETPKGESSADVIIDKYIAGFDVKKEVAPYAANRETDAGLDGYAYQTDTLAFNNGNGRAIFRVTITNNTSLPITIESVRDTYNGNGLNSVMNANGEEFDLAELDGLTLGAGESVVFYYITAAGSLNTNGRTYTNTVNVSAHDGGRQLNGTASASVRPSWTTTTTITRDDPPPVVVVEQPPVEIIDAEPPLAEYTPVLPEEEARREDELVIEEEIVPLGEMPQTGVEDSIAMWTLALCASMLMAGALGVMVTKKGKTKE